MTSKIPRFHAGIESTHRHADALYVEPDLEEQSTTYRQDGLGTGDSSIIYNLLPGNIHEGLFERLLSEVSFQEMSQAGGIVPRLVATQGLPYSHSDLNLIPIYRHPTDSELQVEPMTPTVLLIKEYIEQAIYPQTLNHVLIQLYRYGKDHINEHSDKTLDILRNSNIFNFSVGASRTFILSLKRDSLLANDSNIKPLQKIVLPSNSLFICSWKTNEQFLHGIRPDKRDDKFKALDELSQSGMRISLTFRSIATYQLCESLDLDSHSLMLYGQGARIKEIPNRSVIDAILRNRPVERDPEEEAMNLLKAFSHENRQADFDWDANYGEGFDICNLNHISHPSSS